MEDAPKKNKQQRLRKRVVKKAAAKKIGGSKKAAARKAGKFKPTALQELLSKSKEKVTVQENQSVKIDMSAKTVQQLQGIQELLKAENGADALRQVVEAMASILVLSGKKGSIEIESKSGRRVKLNIPGWN
ncbi:hypothetical protein [Piscirickettsia litoralis]|uniref:Uncharacterized protein n=1 Tax=Piscirickettsia litoralis TaxID=1891921 RepID=A0ABX2ZXJ8_9GAMM|nr:hypothetical protein [Piscirickettsia litoralis]ODN41203.1 hypothetical protein BGC07_17470 [Piscirickettsia litoralis]